MRSLFLVLGALFLLSVPAKAQSFPFGLQPCQGVEEVKKLSSDVQEGLEGQYQAPMTWQSHDTQATFILDEGHLVSVQVRIYTEDAAFLDTLQARISKQRGAPTSANNSIKWTLDGGATLTLSMQQQVLLASWDIDWALCTEKVEESPSEGVGQDMETTEDEATKEEETSPAPKKGRRGLDPSVLYGDDEDDED